MRKCLIISLNLALRSSPLLLRISLLFLHPPLCKSSTCFDSDYDFLTQLSSLFSPSTPFFPKVGLQIHHSLTCLKFGPRSSHSLFLMSQNKDLKGYKECVRESYQSHIYGACVILRDWILVVETPDLSSWGEMQFPVYTDISPIWGNKEGWFWRGCSFIDPIHYYLVSTRDWNFWECLRGTNNDAYQLTKEGRERKICFTGRDLLTKLVAMSIKRQDGWGKVLTRKMPPIFRCLEPNCLDSFTSAWLMGKKTMLSS